MVYRLYITNKNYSSWSMRIWVLMRALGIPFEEELAVAQEAPEQAGFRRFSPTAKVPCLHDGEGEGEGSDDIVVWESLAIAEYLADKHPEAGVWPALATPRARAWVRSAAAEMHAGFGAMRRELSTNCGVRVALGPGEPSAELARELRRLDELWAEGLARFGGPWLAGDRFTAGDAFFAPLAVRLRTYGVTDRLAGEAARGYAARLLEHPAVREWVDAGVRETWRERFHEEEITLGGKEGRVVVEDLRAVA